MNATLHTLLAELRSTPEPLQRQVLDFLLFRKARVAAREARDERSSSPPAPPEQHLLTSVPTSEAPLLPLAETAWRADWDSPEEDEAWRGLQFLVLSP